MKPKKRIEHSKPYFLMFGSRKDVEHRVMSTKTADHTILYEDTSYDDGSRMVYIPELKKTFHSEDPMRALYDACAFCTQHIYKTTGRLYPNDSQCITRAPEYQKSAHDRLRPPGRKAVDNHTAKF